MSQTELMFVWKDRLTQYLTIISIGYIKNIYNIDQTLNDDKIISNHTYLI